MLTTSDSTTGKSTLKEDSVTRAVRTETVVPDGEGGREGGGTGGPRVTESKAERWGTRVTRVSSDSTVRPSVNVDTGLPVEVPDSTTGTFRGVCS